MPTPSKPYRSLNEAERRELDAFYGGFSCALSAALYMHSGTSVEYREALGTIDVHEFYLWARRNSDMELPRIRQYMRDQEQREQCEAEVASRRARSVATPEPRAR